MSLGAVADKQLLSQVGIFLCELLSITSLVATIAIA
jgi:hypothetical protein